MNSLAYLAAISPEQPPVLDSSDGPRYHVGTLSYTKSALINVFLWMLWGDLCLNLMESVIPRMVPLQLQSLGVSNAVIGVLTGSVFSLMNWVMNPIISTWSDRHRSPLGRRMPFMLYPTPFLALFLASVGFAGNIAHFVSATSPRISAGIAHAAAWIPQLGGLSPSVRVTIVVIAVLLIVYKFFDLFPQCVYYYLFADVIPHQVMGKFVCLFRMVGTLGAFVFHFFLLRYADTHPQAIYIGCAALYLVAFISLSLMVKEGTYPPPPPRPKSATRSIREWFITSYSTPFFWNVYLANAAFKWGFVPFNTFLIIFAQKRLKMDPGDFGHVLGIVLAVQMPLLLVLGPVLDRFHPSRIAILGSIGTLLSSIAGFYLVGGHHSFLWMTLVIYLCFAVQQGSLSTLGPRLMPRQLYGQLCAANAMVGEAGMLIFAWLCGTMLDRFGERTLYLWLSACAAFAVLTTFFLYRAWLRHGGDEAYVPPGEFQSEQIVTHCELKLSVETPNK